MSLLEKAMLVRMEKGGKKSITDEDIELAIAWLEGKVTVTQIGKAYSNRATNSCMYRISNALRVAFAEGKIVRKQ